MIILWIWDRTSVRARIEEPSRTVFHKLGFIREQKVLSKLEGGRWGIANLPKKYHALIEQALLNYQATKKHAQNWKHDELETFANHMTSTILKESKLKM